MRRRLALEVGAFVVVGAVAGCAGQSSSEGTDFADSGNFTQWAYVRPGSEVVLGLPALHNQGDQTAHVTSMQWPDHPPTITVLSVSAVSYSQTDGGVGIAPGGIASTFPSATPKPVASAVIPAHRDSDWMVLMTVRVSPHAKPGTITFTRARVGYTAGGRRYWQYRTMNAQIRVVERLPD